VSPGSKALAFEFAKEPGPGIRPVVICSARGHAEDPGGFLEGQADEVAQLDQFRFDLVLGGEFVERLVHGEHVVIIAG
jgi:hypothetical protein